MNNPFSRGWVKGLRKAAPILISDWTEKNIMLPSEATATPGPLTLRPFQRAVINLATIQSVEELILATSAQIGKTLILTSISGYYSKHDPSPQLLVMPKDDAAWQFKAERYSPTMKASPAFKNFYTRDVKDFLQYPGGYLAFVGANSPTNLASRPIRVLLGDEIDRFPDSAGNEGDPVKLASKRLKTFKDLGISLAILCSTPTLNSKSRIMVLFDSSHQYRWLADCWDCGHSQHLIFENIIYSSKKPQDAHYQCAACAAKWTEAQKQAAVHNGRLAALKKVKDPETGKDVEVEYVPDNPKRVGFHINTIYVSSLQAVVEAWLDAKGKPEEEQTFYNTELGLTYAGETELTVDAEAAKEAAVEFDMSHMPIESAVITIAVDVQQDRLEALPMAHGADERTWALEPVVIDGDPSGGAVWEDLKELLLKWWPHPLDPSIQIRADAVAVDSGYETQNVYKFCRENMLLGRKWYPIKGVDGEGKKLWQESKAKLKDDTRLFLVGTFAGKETVMRRMMLEPGKKRKLSLSTDLADERFEQITAERCELEYDKRNQSSRHWVKKRKRAPNEMLDLCVYNLAVAETVPIKPEDRLRAWTQPKVPQKSAADVASMFNQ